MFLQRLDFCCVHSSGFCVVVSIFEFLRVHFASFFAGCVQLFYKFHVGKCLEFCLVDVWLRLSNKCFHLLACHCFQCSNLCYDVFQCEVLLDGCFNVVVEFFYVLLFAGNGNFDVVVFDLSVTAYQKAHFVGYLNKQLSSFFGSFAFEHSCCDDQVTIFVQSVYCNNFAVAIKHELNLGVQGYVHNGCWCVFVCLVASCQSENCANHKNKHDK